MGIKVKGQGKVVIQWDEEEGLFLMMYPDGQVTNSLTKEKAEEKAKKWFQKHIEKECIGIGEIEWRNLPEEAKIVWSGDLTEVKLGDKKP